MDSSLFFKVLFLLFIASFASSLPPDYETCPEDVPHKSCVCDAVFKRLILTCKSTSDTDLKGFLVALQGKRLSSLHIRDSSIQYIPAGPLSDIDVPKLVIEESKLGSLFDKPLEGDITSTLISLQILSSVFSDGLDLSSCQKLTALRYVTIDETPLKVVPESMKFLGSTVETLKLTRDSIESIHPNAFSGLTGLRHLLLNDNKVQTFTRSMLPSPTSNIEMLDFTNNLLTSFPQDAFDGMPKLEILIIEGNKFKTLEASYMQKIWNQLYMLAAQDNPLECSCNLSFMVKGKRPKNLFGSCIESGSKSVKKLEDLDTEYFGTC